ncbi:helix-turn-helix domain-containing protein [Campylobacter sp. CCUG 57310]|uniref:helix-turn-helix domain-containing protein n=1 Tax=Campylobacter sp. CCUG 57310 TaxID=2517362 RepID=UPI001565DE74|nr:helix-turn-helix domain-containing protein [Campylobacter sp. CCUG 57310]QKF91581.1 DNA binding protein (HTH domain) [Campylobacter sp. CCUG 57310]
MNDAIAEKRWLTPKDVAKEYGLSVNTQAKYRMQRIIPFIKINSNVRYDRLELDRWLEKHAVVKNEELA